MNIEESADMYATLVGVCLVVVLGAIPAKSDVDFAVADVDVVVGDKELVSNFINCLLDDAACSAEGLLVKARLYDVYKNGCEECTEEQKNQLRRLVLYVKENREDEWMKVRNIFDPEMKSEETFNVFIAEV
ncbi:ejaculatory bulb-specific protein 3-like [Periplaneta americana]|uniref:ejaculatory bulb-specific protein 3-like n=1 Tax=Periplaneta americana TaxID=6978 RepID=UPI0037E989C7